MGLTGGIGAGKSTVAALLAEHGALVIDADALAREAVEPGTPGYDAVVREFGAAVVAPDGGLDRSALGRIVFADPVRRAALEAIVHPLIARRSQELAAASPPGAVVVYDVPLLVEAGVERGYDLVVVVDAPDEVRLARLVARGLDRDDVAARVAAQADRATRLAAADVVIDNSGPIRSLASQVDSLWAEISQ